MDDKNTEEFESGGKSSISADLIRGHINTIILRSLYDRDKYGYEIINEINEKSHGQYTLKQPTLYSALKRLETQGYIQAYWKTDEVSAGGRRKYFRLTDSGREITEQNQAEWEYSRTVIDNLISDRNFDFNQPAPTPVDFKILKQATSRVPVVHGEGEEDEEKAKGPAPSGMPVAEVQTYVAEEAKTVFIDDPEKVEKKTEKENSEEISYTANTEKPLTYSEEIFSSGRTSISQDAENQDKTSVQSSEQLTQSEQTIQTKNEAVQQSAAQTVQETKEVTEENYSASATHALPEENAENFYSRTETESRTVQSAAPAENVYTVKETFEQTERTDFSQSNERYENLNADNGATADSRTDGYPYRGAETQQNASVNTRNSYTSQLGRSAEEEARRKVHENYLKLISGDEGKKRASDETPYAENVDTSRLIYNSRPEQERDYKNLIDKLFDNTLKNTEPAPIAPAPAVQSVQQIQPQPQQQPETMPEQVRQNVRYNYFDASSKAASDGLKISTSDEAFAAGSARQTTYNKGATLFKCSLIIAVIMLLEFTLTLLFKDELKVSVAYPIIILALGLSLVLVCGILFGARYGSHVRKPTSLRYISTSCIITVLLICIIFIFSIILQVNWSSNTDVLAKVVIPCIITLNVPIFTLSFYLFTK